VPQSLLAGADEAIESDRTALDCFWHKADIPTHSINVRFWG